MSEIRPDVPEWLVITVAVNIDHSLVASLLSLSTIAFFLLGKVF